MKYPEYVEYPTEEPYPQPERNKPLLSSLILQQSLYYNGFYDIPYALVQILLFAWKYKNSTKWQIQYVTPIVLALFLILEPVRLSLGWRGNLLEQAPQILAFLFMSCFLSIALVVYYGYGQSPITGLDKALAWVYLGLVILQILGGFALLVRLIRYRTARFAVEQFVVKEEQHPLMSPASSVGSPAHSETEMALLRRPRPIVPPQFANSNQRMG